MLPNPYTPGGRPRVFVGRTAESRRIRGHLSRVIAYGEMMGALTVVTGPRGVGKTSLMRDVQDQAQNDGLIVAWVAGTKHTPFLSELVDQVRHAVRSHDAAPKSGGMRLDEIGAELNMGLAKVSAKLANDSPAEPPTALIGGLTRFLHEASTAVRARGGAGLVIVIDELHAPLESTHDRRYVPNAAAHLDAATLLNAAQTMDADRESYPLALLGAGLPETKSLLMRAATFGERTRELTISELDPVNSEKLLTRPAENLGVSWDAKALTRVTDTASGYPYALQVAGEATWDAAQPDPGSVLTTRHVEDGYPQAAADMYSMYRGRWELATPAERVYLAAMATSATPHVRRADLAEILGVTPDALNPARDSLISKGIIESAGHGLVRFTIPGFATFIEERDDATLPAASPPSARHGLRPPDPGSGGSAPPDKVAP